MAPGPSGSASAAPVVAETSAVCDAESSTTKSGSEDSDTSLSDEEIVGSGGAVEAPLVTPSSVGVSAVEAPPVAPSAPGGTAAEVRSSVSQGRWTVIVIRWLQLALPVPRRLRLLRRRWLPGKIWTRRYHTSTGCVWLSGGQQLRPCRHQTCAGLWLKCQMRHHTTSPPCSSTVISFLLRNGSHCA